MGRLDERLGAAPVSRFDLVAEPSELNKNINVDEQSLEEWYACCRSSAPHAASFDFFCRVWPDNALHPSTGLLSHSSAGQQGGADEPGGRPDESEVPSAEVAEQGSHDASSASSDAARRLLSRSEVGAPVRCQKPVYMSRHTRDLQHKLVCFTPGTKAAGGLTAESIERGQRSEVNDADAAEGSSRPTLLRRNLNKMANRLMVQGNTGWSVSGAGEGCPLVTDLPTEDVLFRQHQAREAEAGIRKALVRFVEAAGQDASLSLLPACTMHLVLHKLAFDHHPLLAAEHLLARRLTTAVGLYNDRIAKGHTELLLQKVKVLRSSLSALNEDENQLHSSEPTSNDVSPARRAELYRTSIADTRKQLHASGLRDRQLLTEAISSWTELKELRQSQGYVVTPWVFNIKKSECLDPEGERRWWEKAQAAEVEELLQEEESQYQERVLEHQQQLQQWQKLRAQKKQARRRLHMASAGAADDASQLQTTTDQLSLASPLPPRPIPPPKPPSREQIVSQVRSTFKRSLRPPGEPELQLLLSESAETVTATKLCPLQERRRRQAVARTEVAVKIFVNNKPVTQTPWHSLNDQDLKMSLQFPVVAATVCEPRTLGLQLLQSTTSSPATAKIRKVIALGSHTCDLTRFSDLDARDRRCRERDLHVEFTSDEVFCYSHAGVGAGRDDPLLGNLLTRAHLTARCSLWSGPVDAPVPSADEANEITTSTKKPAPSGDEVESASRRRGPTSFECDGESCGPAWLCSREALDSNLRHQLLRLRQQKAGHFRDMSRIPPLTSQILRASAMTGEARRSSSPSSSVTQAEDVQPSDDDDWLDDVAEQLAGAQELVSSVRRRLLQKTAEAAAVPTTADMVQEEQIPDIGTLGLSLVSLFRPKRPLKPDRKVRGVVRAGVVPTGRRVSLILNVARAFNVPVRDDLNLASGLGASQDQEEEPTLSVRPYVTVSFQGRHARTSVAHGPNPTWNQQLVLPFRPASEDESSTGLVKENISLQLYDERILDDDSTPCEALSDTGAETEETGTVRARLHNTWLASLCIPTAALLRNACKIEGTFELSSPVSVLGYRRTADAGTRGTRGGGSTTLTLYLTLEPALPQPPNIDASLLPSSGDAMGRCCKAWLSSLQDRYPQRLFICCSYTMTGQLTPLDRFIAPIPPPVLTSSVESPEQQQWRIAWFVSLLPALPDMSVLSDSLNITTSCDQFVKQCCGGEAERAILLTCYFLHLGYEAYLMLGSSVCEGQLWCSLVRGGPPSAPPDGDASRKPRGSVISDGKMTPSWKIWCPASAKVYSTRDPFCPVKSVYVLADQTNVWGNCQKFDDPARVQFSMQEGSGWRALYGSGGPPLAVPCVQPRSIDYGLPAPHHDKELREKLTLIVRDAFMKWRPLHKTVWNRHACDVLRGLVRRLEGPRASGGTAPPPPAPLLRLYQSHSVCGVCVHQGWRGIGPLLAAVRSTAVHACALPEAEFALAVYTHPYPARATSVWLYVASLVRKTS